MIVKELLEMLNSIDNKNMVVLLDTGEDYNPVTNIKLISAEDNPIDYVKAIVVY